MQQIVEAPLPLPSSCNHNSLVSSSSSLPLELIAAEIINKYFYGHWPLVKAYVAKVKHCFITFISGQPFLSLSPGVRTGSSDPCASFLLPAQSAWFSWSAPEDRESPTDGDIMDRPGSSTCTQCTPSSAPASSSSWLSSLESALTGHQSPAASDRTWDMRQLN